MLENVEDEELGEGISNTVADVQRNYAKKFIGQVIYIESYRWRGHWMDASRNKHHPYFSSVPQEDLVEKAGVKWLVRDVGSGNIALESIYHDNYFLDAHHSKWCKLAYTSYPNNKDWAKFKLERTSNGRYMFRSIRYKNHRLDSYESFWNKYWPAITKGKGLWAQFRIYQPPKEAHWKRIFGIRNQYPSVLNYKYARKYGISRTHGYRSTKRVSSQIGVEIKGALSAGLSSSAEWSHFGSETYHQEISQTVSINVQPHSNAYVYQLQATYGHFKVKGDLFQVLSKELNDLRYRVVYTRSMDDYNNGKYLRVEILGPKEFRKLL